MNRFWALTGRELKAFWCSPIAYVVGALFLLIQGLEFWLLVNFLSMPRLDPSITMPQLFFGGFYFWLSVLMLVPLLTMRTFSEEKRTGSIELLLTAPVTDAQVVLAKFLGAWLAYAILWSCTLAYFLLLRAFTAFAWAPVLTGYLGVWLLGGVLIAVGVLASSLTRNQIIAAVMAFGAMLVLFSVGVLEVFVRDPEGVKIIRYLSLLEHLGGFAKGIVDTRPIVFYATLTAACLFLTGRVVGHPRWRA
ncbi:MAG: ABC transporter permease [Candidatus Omnitrophica bacterium]|nr:ABC transporter permease [Candidatus Omnitrophota bacterium]